MKITLTWIFVAFLLSLHASAQQVVQGRVLNENGHPLQAVTISRQQEVLTFTDSLGNFSILIPEGRFPISFSYIGYEPVTIYIDRPRVLEVFMMPASRNLEAMIIQAFERNGTVLDLPAAVTVLNKATLAKYDDQSLLAAMNTVPGVKMDERSPGSYRLSIRGNLLRSTFGVRNVKVYWNGIPITDASNNTYLNQLSLHSIDRIEVIKGPSGSMYGAGTGGVVLLGTNYPQTEQSLFGLGMSAGNYGSLSSDISWKKSGPLHSTSSTFTHQQNDGYRSNANLRRDMAHFSGQFFNRSRGKLHANIFYSDLYYQTPGGLTGAEMAINPRQSRPASGQFKSAAEQKAALYLKTIYAGLGTSVKINEQWQQSTAVYYTTTDFKNPTIRNYELRKEKGGGFRSFFTFKDKRIQLVTGGEYQAGFSNSRTHANKLGVMDSLQYHDNIRSQQFNIFSQLDVYLARGFVLTIGSSYNDFSYALKRVSEEPGIPQQSNFGPEFIPRIAILKKFNPRLDGYVSVSKGFSPPSLDEVHASDGIFNKALRAEKVFNYELGLKGQLLKNKLWLDASAYFFNLRNTIVSRRDSSGADYYVNAGKTRQWGLEMGLNYQVFGDSIGAIRQLRLALNATITNARFIYYQQGTVRYDGNDLTGTPDKIISITADIQLPVNIYCNLTYNHTGEIPLNDANLFYARPYDLFFIKPGYKRSSYDIFIKAMWAFRDTYSLGNDLNAAGNRFYNPSAPFTISAGARFLFNLK